MIFEIHCDDDAHLERSSHEGWADPLGTVELPDDTTPENAARATSGYLCAACADARAEAAADDAVVTPADAILAALGRAETVDDVKSVIAQIVAPEGES